jgi:hypothetical protein
LRCHVYIPKWLYSQLEFNALYSSVSTPKVFTPKVFRSNCVGSFQ